MPNSKDIIEKIALQTFISQNKAKDVLMAICEYITQNLETEQTVTINGFGSFSVKKRQKKIKTEEAIESIETTSITFKTGETLAKRLRKNNKSIETVNDGEL